MIKKKILIISMLLFTLIGAGFCLHFGSRWLTCVYLTMHIALLIHAGVSPSSMIERIPDDAFAWPPRRRYQPRQTDAGKWVEAPTAELDKSTFGKLLASRLRREPGLNVVVRPERPEICSEPLYDPELDGC